AKIGRAIAVGTASSTAPTEAFETLRAALGFDNNAGKAFEKLINDRLGEVAPKAAIQYFATKKYDKAHDGVRAATDAGAGSNKNVSLVRGQLEQRAGDLYGQAIKQYDSSPDDAKEKLRMVEKMVDTTSSWYSKARQKLGE